MASYIASSLFSELSIHYNIIRSQLTACTKLRRAAISTEHRVTIRLTLDINYYSRRRAVATAVATVI